jgi:hypothetical protein
MRYIIALVMVAIVSVTSIKLFNGVQEIPSMPASAKASEQSVESEEIMLSHKEHFYEDTIEISITASNSEHIIYYTLDGSQPVTTSEKYTKPIEIKSDTGVIAKTLRAIAVRDSKEVAAVNHTYFVGKGVRARFSTMVVSLSTDPQNLYDYETGIFVEGKLRDDFITANPGVEAAHYHPANYNMRGRLYERPVYVEMFDADGKQVISQKAGIRTHGGWARSLPQKSIRLIARNEYDNGKGKFDYDFFQDDKKYDVYSSPIDGYDSLVLRAIANYEKTPMLNNEIASKLARDAGYHETLFFRPTAVFLNGEYYGFSFLEQSINEQTLQESYDAPELSFDIAGTGEIDLEEVEPEVLADLQALNAFASKDLTNDKNYEELAKILDIDNFLRYYALEVYLGNSDWPDNNLKRWRYTGDLTAPNLHPYLDGRWRYILFDFDRTFGFMPDVQPTLDILLGESERSSPMLKAMLKRSDGAQKFLAILSELADGGMAPEQVEKVLSDVYEESKQEVAAAKEAGKFTSLLTKDNGMLTFAHKRWQILLPQVKRALGYSKTFQVTIKGISKQIYPLGCTVSFTPKLSRYEVFDGWLLNGVQNDQEKLNITENDVKDGQVIIEQLTHVELPPLQITEVSESSNRVTLRNNTDTVISTRGFYLTDDASNLNRWAFTPMRIQPGETVTIVGSTISNNTVLFTPQLNFNIKLRETIILSDGSGQVIDYHIVE